jgi:hypothetical protein
MQSMREGTNMEYKQYLESIYSADAEGESDEGEMAVDQKLVRRVVGVQGGWGLITLS